MLSLLSSSSFVGKDWAKLCPSHTRLPIVIVLDSGGDDDDNDNVSISASEIRINLQV